MKDQDPRGVSHGFKITVIILFFVLTILRLISVLYFPINEIIPDKVFLFVILSILFYLWLQELKDFKKLMKMNKDLLEAHEHLKEAQISTIAALIKAEEAKDLYTSGHSEMVRKIALAIAQEMNLSKEKQNIIARAAILHDIGKIGLNDAILNKKERLTDAEMKVIRKQPLNFLSLEKEIIIQHHEHYDGTGYPRGLKGREIRPEALIIGAADTFDAMNSRRAYREALTEDAIITELKRCRGTQHPTEVIDVLLRLIEKNPGIWERY
jgi:HD-GYP domain-containing protein (c-di-GMP phosphodiesterase class II)